MNASNYAAGAVAREKKHMPKHSNLTRPETWRTTIDLHSSYEKFVFDIMYTKRLTMRDVFAEALDHYRSVVGPWQKAPPEFIERFKKHGRRYKE